MRTPFDPHLWRQIGERFRLIRGEEKVKEFLEKHNLEGIHWTAIEQGRAGTSVESIVKICWAKDVSPSWLLFGDGHQNLSHTQERDRRRTLIKGVQSNPSHKKRTEHSAKKRKAG
jgi:hypothetical protein